MRYSEIIDYPRSWNRETHPIVAHIEIEAEQFSEFQRFTADQTQVRVLGHDEAGNGRIVAHVACTSADAKRRIENRWASP
jgi:hypothetical protein